MAKPYQRASGWIHAKWVAKATARGYFDDLHAECDLGEPCLSCDDGDGRCAFPYYGAAPHECFDMLGLQIGQSRELPQAEWPANFVLDPDAGPATGYPRAGTYTHCLVCGAAASA